MSLHQEFSTATHSNSSNHDILWNFGSVTGQLAVFAESIAGRLQEALVRLKAGQPSYEFDKGLLGMNFEVQKVLWSGKFDYSVLEQLPGYRRLVEVTADPANDIAFTLEIKGYYAASGKYQTAFTVTLAPGKPFNKSMVQYQADRQPYASLQIAENGVPAWAQTKPKAKLSVPTHTNS